MPLVGLGTWKAPKGEVTQALKAAVRLGYRLVDCAADYGNEEEVGSALQEIFAEGQVSRQDLFVTSKLWNTFHAREHVREGLLKTLGDLKLEYLDLYLIHFPISLKYVPIATRYPPEWTHDPVGAPGQVLHEASPIRDTWEALEALVDEGLVRNIGVSNFSAALLMDLNRYARIKPSVLQIEHHPYLQQPTLISFARSLGIHTTAYSSFGQISYLPLGQPKLHPDLLTEVAVLQAVAAAHGRSPAQVILRWTTQRGIAVIPKSLSEARLAANIDLAFDLSDDELKQIAALERHARFNNPGVYINYPIFD